MQGCRGYREGQPLHLPGLKELRTRWCKMHAGESGPRALSPNSGGALCLAWGEAAGGGGVQLDPQRSSSKDTTVGKAKENESFRVTGRKGLGQPAGCSRGRG